MKRVAAIPVAACLLALLDGCATHLEVSPETRNYTSNDVQVGADYGLPMLQYRLKVTRTLATCSKKNAADKADIQFLAKVEAEPHYITGERYSVDYTSLSNWSKVTSLELQTYDSGTLKSINGSAEDQTAGIIGDVVKTGIGIAGLVAGVPPGVVAPEPAITESKTLAENKSKPPPPPPPPPPGFGCKKSTQDTLSEIDAAKATLDSRTEKLSAMTTEIARLARALSAGGLVDEDKRRLVRLQGDIETRMKAVSDSDRALADLTAKVSIVEEIIWPTEPTQRRLHGHPNSRNSKRLFELFEDGKPGGVTHDQLHEAMSLVATLDPIAPTTTSPVSVPPSQKGFLYRTPVPAQLIFCQTSDSKDCTARAASAVVISTGVLAPQFGPLRLLPLDNGLFQNNALTAAFRENGGLASFKYEDKAARGKVLSAAAASAVGQIATFQEAKTTLKQKQADAAAAADAAKQKAVVDDLDNQIAILQKNQKIAMLQSDDALMTSLADTTGETARQNARAALLDAQLKSLQAAAALAKAGTP